MSVLMQRFNAVAIQGTFPTCPLFLMVFPTLGISSTIVNNKKNNNNSDNINNNFSKIKNNI